MGRQRAGIMVILKSLDSGSAVSQDVLTLLLAGAEQDMDAADAELKMLPRKLEGVKEIRGSVDVADRPSRRE